MLKTHPLCPRRRGASNGSLAKRRAPERIQMHGRRKAGVSANRYSKRARGQRGRDVAAGCASLRDWAELANAFAGCAAAHRSRARPGFELGAARPEQ